METVEPREKRMRIALDVGMIVGQDGSKELVLGVGDRLDDEAVVSREVEERARFARRPELGEDVLGGEGEEVVGCVEVEVGVSEVAEDPRSVVFELEVVSGGGRELVADAGREGN
jgi:hypothetical protein